MRLTGFSLKAVLVGLLLVVPAKSAQEAAAQGSIDSGAVIGFDIPAQPLERALLTYSRIANVQVLYDAALVQAQHSSPVQGSYRATEALELLLRGTGLRVRYATAEAITLTAISTGGEGVLHVQAMRIQGSPEALDRRRMASYAQSVEGQILEALRRDPSTSHIPFDVKMDVWLDTDRRIARAEMVASDVGEKADVAILSVVRSATLSDPPPSDLPQPLSFRFRSRPAF
jgi:hypothetical protein